MKEFVKKVIGLTGYEIKKSSSREVGSDKRPIGRIDFLLEDLKSRGLKCKTILDVGANATDWSRMAKKVFPSARFCLIEPQVEMKGKLEDFCKEFNNSIYVLAGAGAKKEILTFTVWDDLAGSSFLPKPQEELKNKGKQRQIEIVTINELIETGKIDIPDLIKLDIQGFELEALKGATSTLGKTEVYILEVGLFQFGNEPGMPVFSDVINFMLERDYVVYDFPGFLRRPLDGALGQCDICFVKKNGFLIFDDISGNNAFYESYSRLKIEPFILPQKVNENSFLGIIKKSE